MVPWGSIVEGGEVPLLLVRHGRTAWNAAGRFLGRTDRPLDAVGREQVAGLSRWSGAFDAVYSSPLARARQTASVLAPPRARVVHALAELDQGHLEGLTLAEGQGRFAAFFEAWAADPERVVVPGGGCLGAARDAALSAMVDLAGRHRGPVAVVGHQLVFASVLATLAGDPLTRWRAHRLANGGWAMLAFDGQSLRRVASAGPGVAPSTM